MAARKRRRGGGHPAKVAARREREHSKRQSRARETSLRRAARAMCREAAGLEGAFEAEYWASILLGSWWSRRLDLDHGDPDLEIGGPVVEELARDSGAGAVAALVALEEVSDSELGAQAGDAARRLIAEGAPAPPWSEAIEEAEILRTAVMREDVFDDGITVWVESRHGDEEPHAIGVYIDHNLGVMAKDLVLADSIESVEQVMRERPEGDGELRIDPIDPAEAGVRIHDAMALTDMTVDPPVGEEYAPLRALALLRADELPGGKVDIEIPEVPREERDRMLDQFLASPEAAGIAAESDETEAVAHAIDFCADYVDGRPLRWSPVVVELFMADWLPRKVLAERSMFEAVPRGLEAWVRFAGRERNVPDWAIDRTIEAIPRWTNEMLDASDDPAAAGPAKQFLAAAQQAGVNITDQQALDAFIDEWNAQSKAA